MPIRVSKPNVSRPARRTFLVQGAVLAGTTLLSRNAPAQAERALETTKLRFPATPGICVMPQYVAEPLLRAEGFTDIEYTRFRNIGPVAHVPTGEADMVVDGIGPVITQIDAGEPLVVLAGIHLGCYELFGGERVRAIRDLKGKRIPINGFGGPQHVFLSAMLGYLGLDPRKDVEWIEAPFPEGMQMFMRGQADAYLGFPPEPQELRAKRIGRVLVNTATDRPWSQYYCCMLTAHREYVRRYPVATKRALRAILKATDLCAEEPERTAQQSVDRGFAANYAYAIDALSQVRYDAWRAYDPSDTLRFHALRLHEAGLIKSTPQRIIAQGTDWRFLNEIKKELKA
jgi:NitT/TauT family transport system substrate-binding protein